MQHITCVPSESPLAMPIRTHKPLKSTLAGFACITTM